MRFEVTSGGGSVSPSQVVSNAQGEARVTSWTLGERAGVHTLTASAGSLTSTITATARAGPPQTLEKNGDGQNATVSTAVPVPVGVVVRDRFANPVPDIPVSFTVIAGGGRLEASAGTSNALGFASPGVWTLGMTAGLNVIQASVSGVPSVELMAAGRAGPPMRILKAGDQQSATVGTETTQPIEVTLLDAHDNPAPNVSVVFEVTVGGGVISGATATTGIDGKARSGTWRLGTKAGLNELRASVGTLAATFSARGLPDRPAMLALIAGNQQVDTVDATLPIRAVVEVTDRYLNAIAGVNVAFTITGGGGRVSSVTPSDSAGRASAMWTLGAAAGANTLTASIPDALQPVVFAATAEWPPFRASRVVAGHDHTCALNLAGKAFCWGDNSLGELGDGSTVDRSVPVAVAGGHVFTALEAGHSHSCGLTTSGELYCWGYNALGQLGDGSLTNRNTPVRVTGGHTFKSVVAGSAHTCAITDNDQAYCWGSGGWGQLGNGVLLISVPIQVSGGIAFRSLDAGDLHTCGISTNGATYCWGDGGAGRIGDGNTLSRLTPVAVAGGHAFVSIGAGGAHSCGLVAGGQLYCWGGNGNGSLGDGTTTNRDVPTPAAGTQRFGSIALGTQNTCAVDVGSVPFCWGDNSAGQLGRGYFSNGPNVTPQSPAFTTSTLATAVYIAPNSACAIASSSQLFCWGRNASGELGDGTTTWSPRPVRVRAR
ncbi:MAG: hypothetical protein ACRENH_13670 [Gemmatimonadaceae bacterium]